MRIACLGGGPAGLYFSILAKKENPSWDITVFERNRPTDTFGWGIVFSDKTMDGFRNVDPETHAEITPPPPPPAQHQNPQHPQTLTYDSPRL